MGRVLAIAVLLSLQAAPVGPVMYWKLDEASGAAATPADDFVGTNDGTHAGTPTPSLDRPAAITFANAQSLSFDGVDDQVTRATVTGITAGNTAHTIAMWIKVSALPANRAWIAQLGNEGTGSHHWLINSAGVTQFGVWGGAGQKAPVIPVDGVWRHLATTFNGTNLSAYVDGVEVGTPVAATFNLQGVPFSIAQAHNGENFFNGLLDDVRLYSRALTAAEVLYLAQGNGPPAAPQNFQAVPAIQAIDLSWNAVAGAASYTLRRSLIQNDPNPPVIASGLTGLSYNDPGLTAGTTYYYYLTAVAGVGDESAVATANAIPLPIPPRTNNHDEGLIGDNCSCGSSVTSGSPWILLAAGLFSLGARSRRRTTGRRA